MWHVLILGTTIPLELARDVRRPDQRAAQHAAALKPKRHVGAVLQLVRQQHSAHQLRAHVRVRVAVINERRVRGVEWIDPAVIL